jgi:integrase
MTAVTAVNRAPGVELATLADVARSYGQAAKAPETLRGYRSDWRAFTAWCADRGAEPLPAAPELVALYISDLAGRRAVGTIARHLTSIGQAHRRAGHPSPTGQQPVVDVWAGIRRTFGTAGQPKAALVTTDVRALVGPLGAGLIDVRDRALLLVGFAGAMRRSELVALDVADIEDIADGLVVTIRRSKTDQDGAGAVLGVPWGSGPSTCPVRAYRAWLAVSGIESGAVFRQVDRHGRLLAGRMSGRARARVMRHWRHKPFAVFRSYIRDLGLFGANAGAAVRL